MKYKSLLIISSAFLFMGCSSSRKVDENKMLTASLSSKKFIQFYDLCRKKEDTIYVYNNLENFENCPSVNIDCDRTIVMTKSNIKIDLNSPGMPEDKIVLRRFEKVKNIYRLVFLNIQSNGVIMMNFNRRSKLVNYETGYY